MTDSEEKRPKVSPEERERQIASVYEDIGRISVAAEHLNFTMIMAAETVLQYNGLDAAMAQVLFVGQNTEQSRRSWVMVMKKHYENDNVAIEMITHLDKRIEAANKRRNTIIHQVWWVGWGNEATEDFSKAHGTKISRDFKKGGIKINNSDTAEFKDLINEMKALNDLVFRFRGCVFIAAVEDGKGIPANNFEFVDGILCAKTRAQI